MGRVSLATGDKVWGIKNINNSSKSTDSHFEISGGEGRYIRLCYSIHVNSWPVL